MVAETIRIPEWLPQLLKFNIVRFRAPKGPTPSVRVLDPRGSYKSQNHLGEGSYKKVMLHRIVERGCLPQFEDVLCVCESAEEGICQWRGLLACEQRGGGTPPHTGWRHAARARRRRG